MLQALLHRAVTGKPLGVFKYAMTLDGKIATSSGHSAWVSSSISRQQVNWTAFLSWLCSLYSQPTGSLSSSAASHPARAALPHHSVMRANNLLRPSLLRLLAFRCIP